MHNVYLNNPFVVVSDSKLKLESLSGYDRCCRYLTILRAPYENFFSFLLSFKILTHMRRKTDLRAQLFERGLALTQG